MSREGEAMDARLCALIDGALDPAAEAELRAELAASPELAARLAELRAVDAALRALPERPVPGDALAQLRQRIAAEPPAAAAPARAPAAHRAPRRRRRGWVPALVAAAVAAGLALLVLPRLGDAPSSEERPLARRPEPETTPPMAPAPAPPTAQPSAEEIALALAVEDDADLEVIEMLDWLTALGEVESS